MISVLDFLEKRYKNGETLFVNLENPQKYSGSVHFINSFSELPANERDAVVAKDIFLNLYDYKTAFKKVRGAVKRSGGFILLHEIAGAEEAYLNTLFTVIRKKFVRAPTPIELLDASFELFDVEEFHRFSSPRFFEVDTEALDDVKRHVSSFPRELQEELQLSLIDNTLKVNVFTGVFRWTAV